MVVFDYDFKCSICGSDLTPMGTCYNIDCSINKPIKKLKVLDLCSGLGGFSQAFLDRGHDVLRIDNNPVFKNGKKHKYKKYNIDNKIISEDGFWIIEPVPNTIILDLMQVDMMKLFGEYDVILASPPCQTFSVASISTHWTGGSRAYQPKTEQCKKMIELVKKCKEIIHHLEPKLFFIENPRGVLRKLDILKEFPIKTITYCQYGENRMKPTDIWTNSEVWQPKPMCKNGDPCHESAPRGAKTGTQGLKNAALRAKVPYDLSLEICLACEKEIGDNI